MICKHEYKYLNGRDAIPNDVGNMPIQNYERVCSICGMCGLYSALKGNWVDVGYIHDHFPDEVKTYVQD